MSKDELRVTLAQYQSGIPADISNVRRRATDWLVDQLDKPCLWGKKGPEVFDCSGLVTCCILAMGGPDLRVTYNAQRLYDESEPSDTTEHLSLAFYGAHNMRVEHVAIWCASGQVVSASGATSRIKTFEAARAAGARVRVHKTPRYRPDFLRFHRNIWLENLEFKEKFRGTSSNELG